MCLNFIQFALSQLNFEFHFEKVDNAKACWQIFHLITSRETRVSIAVAEDSRALASTAKEDSTAMKTGNRDGHLLARGIHLHAFRNTHL